MNSYSLEDKIHDFSSALNIESGTSLLEHLYSNNKRTENCCIIMLQELLKLCVASKYVDNMFGTLVLPAIYLPNMLTSSLSSSTDISMTLNDSMAIMSALVSISKI